jgi:hypothetical protein
MTLGLQGQRSIPSAMARHGGLTKKILKNSLIFGSKMMEKIPHNIGNYVSPFEMWIQLVKVSA